MNSWSKLLLVDALSLLLGIALTGAFAPYGIFPLAFLAPACLLFLILRSDPKRAFWLGFIFGLGFFGAGVYWIYISVHVFGDVPSILAALITAGVVVLMAAYPGLTSFLVSRYFPHQNATKLICAFPAIWVLTEWIRSWLFGGFPWLLLGYSQTNSPLKGYAPILGVYGVSLAAVITSGLLVNAYLKYRERSYRAVYLSLVLMAAIWISGSLLSLIPWTKATNTKPITLSLVQGNIPQEIKWSPEHLQLSFDRYQELTEPLWGKSDLIIWPEAAIPMPLQDASEFIEKMDEKAKEHHSHLLLGIPITVPKGNGYYNAIISLGETKTIYLKRHLVPFGEYTPFEDLLSRALNFMDIPMSNLFAGKMQQSPMLINGVKILPAICFEIAFPELMLSNDAEIGMLLTVTNDAWFGKSNAQAQHLQMAEMRSIEHKRPAVMVSNDGITAIINANGESELTAPVRKPFVLSGKIQPTVGLTPWMRNGMDPVLVMLLALLFVALRAKKQRAQQVSQPAFNPTLQSNQHLNASTTANPTQRD